MTRQAFYVVEKNIKEAVLSISLEEQNIPMFPGHPNVISSYLHFLIPYFVIYSYFLYF